MEVLSVHYGSFPLWLWVPSENSRRVILALRWRSFLANGRHEKSWPQASETWRSQRDHSLQALVFRAPKHYRNFSQRGPLLVDPRDFTSRRHHGLISFVVWTCFWLRNQRGRWHCSVLRSKSVCPVHIISNFGAAYISRGGTHRRRENHWLPQNRWQESLG